MTEVALYAIGSTLLVSLLSLVGLFTLSLRESVLSKYVFVLVSLAVGALLGDAFIHLIPEAFEEIENTFALSLSILGGILLFFVLEKVLHWHHYHGTEDEAHALHPVGKMLLITDGVHNFIDGVIIGVSFLAGIEVGIATTLAVILHEIPQEIGDFGVLIHAGYTRAKALFLNFLSALFAVAGVVLALLLGEVAESVTVLLVPFAVGGFIYIAMADLIPELHKTRIVHQSLVQFVAIIIGVAAMVALLALE